MPDPYVIDAGPAINFLATGNARLLIAAANGPFHAPQAVKEEVLRKAGQDARFAPAAKEWAKMEKNWIRVLPGNRDPDLDRLARILTGAPLPTLPSMAKDLGESYVVVQATQIALGGVPVFVLIDDQGGQQLAQRAQVLLAARRRTDSAVANLILVTTESILRVGIKTQHIPNKAAMRRIYAAIRNVDPGKPDIAATDLLTHANWK